MELLAPAGGMDSIKAAVQNGADAVYFGGASYNARRFANNFDADAMREAIKYCHVRGVKTNITLNTLLFDKELHSAIEYAKFLHKCGADAVIVQDIGLARLLKSEIEKLAIHASTQMGIHDIEGARLAVDMGFDRVVLSREVPLDEIKRISDSVPIELEAFAHGALCMGFSGGCLLSSMAGERSGNRGTCAQPCRKRIAVDHAPSENDYALSLSDLCMLEHIDEMKQAGVDSIKIEGRMKRPEYVALATQAYRKAIDGAPQSELMRERERLVEMFDRGGLRTGYFYGDNAVSGCVAKSEPSQGLLKELQTSYASESHKRKIKIMVSIHVDEQAKLTLYCDEVAVSAKSDAVCEKANKPQSKERYAAQFLKLGGTIFYSDSVFIDMDENAFLPVSALNELRRNAVNALETVLADEKCKAKNTTSILLREFEHEKERGEKNVIIHACVRGTQEAAAAFNAGADEVAIEPADYAKAADTLRSLAPYRKDKRLLLMLPNVIISRKEHDNIEKLLDASLIDGAVANNIGQTSMIAHLPIRIAGAAMNVMNTEAANALYALGYNRITVSLELTKPQMRDILKEVGGAVEIFSQTPLMQLKHCPVKEYTGCMNCDGNAGELVDEGGRHFPLSNIRQADSCLVRVLNCFVTDITDVAFSLQGMEAVTLIMRNEDAFEVSRRVANAVLARNGEQIEIAKNATRGHWSRAVE